MRGGLCKSGFVLRQHDIGTMECGVCGVLAITVTMSQMIPLIACVFVTRNLASKLTTQQFQATEPSLSHEINTGHTPTFLDTVIQKYTVKKLQQLY